MTDLYESTLLVWLRLTGPGVFCPKLNRGFSSSFCFFSLSTADTTTITTIGSSSSGNTVIDEIRIAFIYFAFMFVEMDTNSKAAASAAPKSLKHKRRYCSIPNCTRIVKSQGLCQRHGAKPRKCKVHDCPKQAQGNFDGMCKAHFKAFKRAAHPEAFAQAPSDATAASDEPIGPQGESVYDRILPACIEWDPDVTEDELPLVAHLREGFESGKPPAWHRNEERLARGIAPVTNPAAQLEDWERELVWLEILILTGNGSASFRHLARSWGRDKGFHSVLAQFICERRGDVERKRRASSRNPGMRRRSSSTSSDGEAVGSAEATGEEGDWDPEGADYGDDGEYDEEFAAELLELGNEGNGEDEEEEAEQHEI